MNDYTVKINECPTKLEPVTSLSQLMDKAFAVANDCLKNAQRINQHMFGIGLKPNEDSNCCPQCFRDVMTMHLEKLNELNEELIRIAEALGV